MRRRANSPPLVPSESAPSSILDGESARERRAVTTLRPAPLAWPYALLFALPIKMTTEVVAEHERMLCGLLASGLRVAILRGGEACTSAGLLVVLVSACVTVTRGGGDGERGRSDDRHLMRSEAMRGRFRRFRVFGIVDGVGGIAAAELLQQHNFTLSTAREVALTASIVRRTLRSEVSGLEPLAAFPLQDVEFNKWLRAKRAHKSMSTEQFLNEVRDHFGERVAFYFAFVDSFVNSLLLLATICVVIYVLLGSSLPHHAGELLLKTAGVEAAEAAAAAEADGEREAEMGVFRLLLAHAPRGQRLIRGVGRTLLRVAELHDWTAYLCVCPILGLAAAACWGPFFVRMWTRRAATLNARWLTRDPLLGLNVGTSGATAEQVVESDQRNPHQSLARLEYETAAAANNDTGGNASPSSSSSTSSHRRRRVAALRVWVRWCGNPCTFLFNAVVLLFVNILFLQWYSYGLMAPSCYCCALIHDASTELVRVEFEPQPDDYLPHEGLPPGEWTARSALEQAHRAVQHAQRKADRAVRQKTTSTWWTTTFREAPKKEDGRLRSIAIDASALHAALRANAPQCASDVSFGIDGLGFDPSSHLHSCTRWITCFDAPPPRHQKKQRRRARKQKRRRRSTTGTGTGTAIATSKSKTGHQVGSDRWVYILVQSMVLAIAMDLVQYELFHRITQALTWYENWSWTAKYERALVRKQVVFFSLNAFSWFFLVAFVMVPYGGELQIWLHQQELRLPFLQRKFSLALIVPPHGWIDGLLDIDGLFVTTLAVTQFSKLLSSFVLPWIVVKCTRAQLGCARSARLRARAALRGMRLRLRRCGDCDPIDPNWKVQQRRIRRMRGRAAAKLLHTSSRSAGKLPQHTVGGAAFDEPRGGGLAVVNVCRRALGCILSCCHSHAGQVRSSPARLAAAGIATERVSVAMSRARQSNARTPQIEIMRGSSAAPLPKSKAKAKRSRQARAGKKAMRERGGLNPCGSTEGQLQHEAHVELVQRHASLDNNVTYEVALFELVTAKLLRTAQPLDSFVLLSSASAEPVATAAEVALASGPIALPPSQTRAGVRALDVWEQARRAPFDESSSYIALVLQFGYVTLFTVAWPLAPLCAVLHNAIQSRCMFGNLCVSTQVTYLLASYVLPYFLALSYLLTYLLTYFDAAPCATDRQRRLGMGFLLHRDAHRRRVRRCRALRVCDGATRGVGRMLAPP